MPAIFQRFLVLVLVLIVTGCQDIDSSQAERAILEALQQKQFDLMRDMRITMANSFFLWSMVVLAQTFFGPAILDALRGWGVHWFQLSMQTQKELAQLAYGLAIGLASLFTLFHPTLAEVRLSIFLLLAGTVVPFTKDYLPGIQTGDRLRRKLAIAQITKLFVCGAIYFLILKVLSPEGINGLTVTAPVGSL